MNANVMAAGFEPCLCATSPMPGVQTYGVPAHFANSQSSQFPQFLPTSSSESSGSSIYSNSWPITSAKSRTSWSSVDADWSRRGNSMENPDRSLQSQVKQLTMEAATWQAKFETLQAAYNALLTRIPAPPTPERKQLEHEDFKDINYWFRHQWTALQADRVTDLSGKGENESLAELENDNDGLQGMSPAPGGQRGQGRSRAGINILMCYIEKKDGDIIDGHRAREIRMHARAVFVGFAMEGKQFASWGDVDTVSRRTFYEEMAHRFKELEYCNFDWKAEQIATDTYPGWKATWVKKQKKISKQPRQESESATGNPNPKHSRTVKTNQPGPHIPLGTNPLNVVQHVPVVNIIPNTPVRPTPTAVNINVPRSGDPGLLQPIPRPRHAFPIGNPLAVQHQTTSSAVSPPTVQPLPGPIGAGSQLQQAGGTTFNQPTPSNHRTNLHPAFVVHNPALPPAQKRACTGAGKMRPSKTSITPRNLCALKWVTLNPKGTTDEFGTHFDGLPATEKEIWEKLSVEAKESRKSPTEWIQACPAALQP